ncbi:MAG: MOSC domain-containing protein, partial [Pseudomonadales bacterium]|nr:MOSC domain-containing protein [Pseudomonadales bacterium]
MECTITGLNAYPVKSCRGSAVETARLTPAGIEGDRQLMIVRDQKFVNQAAVAQLARVATTRLDANTIAFANPEGA